MPVECEIFVERTTHNRLNEDKHKEQISEITHACKNRSSTVGVKGKSSDVIGPVQEGDSYRYSFTVTLSKEQKRSETATIKAIERAKTFVLRAAEARGWSARDKADAAETAKVSQERGPLVVGELSDSVLSTYFDDVYERNPHIRIIHDNTKNFVNSGGEERCHTLLYGEPASAKTVLFLKLKAWYEQNDDNERVAVINAVTISKSGIENWLLDKAKSGTIPEILFFDEIEKFDMANLSCLLAIMDSQGVISRINSRIGRQSAETKVIVWASCNGMDKLKSFSDGALYSRFTHAIPCARPGREVMRHILMTKMEMRRAKGRLAKDEWVNVVMDYAFDKKEIRDPRKIIGMLAGQDRLLDGSYFKDLEMIEALAQQKV